MVVVDVLPAGGVAFAVVRPVATASAGRFVPLAVLQTESPHKSVAVTALMGAIAVRDASMGAAELFYITIFYNFTTLPMKSMAPVVFSRMA